MRILDEILKFNRTFIAQKEYSYEAEDHVISKFPQREIAILTCMDTRLVNFLEDALGIERGEVKVLKTAGNSVSGPFDGVVRSLLVCIYELGVKEIFVIGHDECGMARTTSEGLTKKMLERGVSPEAIYMVKRELEHWADGFSHPVENVEEAVESLKCNPLIPNDVAIHGLMFHPRTGGLELVVNGYV